MILIRYMLHPFVLVPRQLVAYFQLKVLSSSFIYVLCYTENK